MLLFEVRHYSKIVNLFQSNNSVLPDNKSISSLLTPKAELKRHLKKVMPFVQAVRQKVEQLGISALKQNLSFNEYDILKINLNYLKHTLEVSLLNSYFIVLLLKNERIVNNKICKL